MCCPDSNFIELSDIIAIVGVIVNSLLAIWIVKTLQNNLTNKRYLKDHVIEEIKDLRNEYKKFLNELYQGRLKPKQILPWFKLMNIKTQDVMEIINQKYGLDKESLKSYQIELRNMVTEQEEFSENFKQNKCFTLKESSLRDLLLFQQNNNSKFNQLIIDINDKK
ncbi:hypothetical protein [Seonamhaeicola marinus]|uniref:Uncharacterized protein n=1 Tax=Seonamhaeicola marinus TaxID=1912246 RepID=A0A5D0I592_9FLAO|nr:hypothetical protein [Seonamhaeicola marinus]TYA78538.1 hypothetical protein FUA24_09285 [Seonamhaeicola marinus]